MKSQFLVHSLKVYATQLSQTLLLALIAICTARMLGPTNKGIYSMLVLVPMMVVTLGRCGLNNAVTYFCGRKPAASVIYNGFLLMGMIAGISIVLFLPAVFLFRHTFLHDIPATGIVWMMAMIPVFYLYDYFASVFAAIMKIRWRNALILMYPLCQLVLLIVMVVALRKGLAGALLSLSMALSLGVGWSVYTLQRGIAIMSWKVDAALMKQMMRFGLKAHVGGIMEMLNYRADFFLVNLFLGPAAVGFYSVSVNMAEIVWRFPEAVVLILIPRITRMDTDQAKNFTPRICRLILFPVLMICLGLMFLGRLIIVFFFGSSFLPALYPFFFLLPGFLAFAIWKILAGDLLAQGHPLIYSSTSAVAFAVMVLLDLWLIPAWGIAGAAMASSAAYMAVTVLIIMMYRRVTGIGLRHLLLPQKNDLHLLREIFKRDTRQRRKG